MINILVLNYAKPRETELCLRSIKKFCNFDHRVILLNNGYRDPEIIHGFFYNGLIDFLINEPENKGGGFGTVRLFEESQSDGDANYSLWIENDCEIAGPITQNEINSWIEAVNYQNYKCLDLTGGICGANVYSGRSFFINTEFYNSIPKFELSETGEKLYGGPGPFNHVKYLEQFIQEYFKENNYNIAHIRAIKDNGYSSIRENPDGSQFIHRPDTKELKVLKYPTEKYIYPKWSSREWSEVLQTKNWPDWQIPENERADSFVVPQWH